MKKTLLIVTLVGFSYNIFAQKSIVLTPIADDGIGFHAAANAANKNYNNALWDIAHVQPGGFGIGLDTGRTLILFDFKAVPKNIVVKKVSLSLFSYPLKAGPTYHGHSGFDNTAVLQRVTENWLPSKVTWNTRPNVTDQDQVILSKSNGQFQDYVDVDVTNLFLPMVLDNNKNFGVQFKIKNELPTNAMIFCSTKYSDSKKHPQLTIYYEDIKIIDTTNIVTPQPNVICNSQEQIYVPNTFSPNDDGVNDYFSVFSDKELKINYLQIFDRWGNLLFEKENFLTNDTAQGWDGKTNKQAANIGTYIYNLKISDKKGCIKSVSADLNLVR